MRPPPSDLIRDYFSLQARGEHQRAEELLDDALENSRITLEQHQKLKSGPKVRPYHEMPKKPSGLALTPYPIRLSGLDRLAPREFLLKRLNLETGMLVSLCGTGASGKTLLAQHLGLCVANSHPFLGHPIEGPGHRVLHIDQEQSASLTQRRYERLAAGLALKRAGVDRVVLPARLDDPSLPKDEVEKTLVETCRPYGLVILDSLRGATVCDENNSQIAEVLHLLRRVAEETKTVFLFIHHKGKNVGGSKQSARGSSAIYDAVDIQMDLDASAGVITLSCAKNRDGVFWEGLSFQFVDAGVFLPEQHCTERLELQLVADYIKRGKDDKAAGILNALKDGPLQQEQLFEKVGGSREVFAEARDRLLEADAISESRGKHNARIFSLGPNAAYFKDAASEQEAA